MAAKRSSAWRRSGILSLAVVTVRADSALGETAIWQTAADGSWADPSRWSTNPNFPNNGTPAGASYDVRVDQLGAPYTVTLGTDVTVDRLTIGGGATLRIPGLSQFGPRLTVLQEVNVVGAESTLRLDGGTLKGGTLTTANGGTVRTGPNGFEAFVEDVTIDCEVVVEDDMRLHLLGSTRFGQSGRIRMLNLNSRLYASALDGTGEVIFDGFSTVLGATIDPGFVARTGNGDGSFSGVLNKGTILSETGRTITASDGVVNEGVMHAANGGAVILRGDWTNNGSITAQGGTIGVSKLPTPAQRGVLRIREGGLEVYGSFTPADVHAIDVEGSLITVGYLGVILNTGTILNVREGTNTWRIAGGTVRDGTIASQAGPAFAVEDGGGDAARSRLENVRIEAPVEIGAGAALNLSGTTLVAGQTVRLISGTSTGAALELASASAAPPSGLGPGTRIVFDGTSDLGEVHRQSRLAIALPAGVEVVTGSGGGAIGDGEQTSTNAGLISSRTPGRTISLRGQFINTGTIEALDGNVLTVNPGRSGPLAAPLRNDGAIRVGPSGDVNVAGTFTQGIGGTLAIEIAAAENTHYDQLRATDAVQLAGTFSASLADGFVPAPLDAFQALTFASRTGAFDHYQGLDIPGPLVLAPVFSATDLKLIATVPGDANADGLVNFEDLVALSQHYNTPDGGWSGGDFNLDGITDFTDLVLLAQAYNRSAGMYASLSDAVQSDLERALTAPEPVGAIWVLGALSLFRRRGDGSVRPITPA